MKAKECKLYEGLFLAKRKIIQRISSDPHIFVFVAGGSATGKTSQVAKKLRDYLGKQTLILSMDNYFRGQEYYEKHNITFDEPQAVDIDLFFQHLELLKNGQTVKIPDYDFVNFCPIPEAILVKPTQIIIIEGLFALNKRFDSLSDLKIYVETSVNGRLIRRVLRDVERTKQKVNDIVDLFIDQVNIMHSKYIEPQKYNADIIVHNDFIAELETKHIDLEAFLNQHHIPKL